MKKTIIYLTLFILFLSATISQKCLHQDEIDNLQLDQVQNLMIVAHPDDETIWGGYHLEQGNYLVVCLTNGDNAVRKKEFLNILKKTKNQGLILDYPDKTNGKRNNWKSCKSNIYNDICTIMNKKDFKQIITHNPEGEYGHIHHKMTSQLVTKATKDKSKLNYFGKYYRKGDIPKGLTAFTNSVPYTKTELTKIYLSQSKVMDKLQHMFPYENWIPYKEWRTNHA